MVSSRLSDSITGSLFHLFHTASGMMQEIFLVYEKDDLAVIKGCFYYGYIQQFSFNAFSI